MRFWRQRTEQQGLRGPARRTALGLAVLVAAVLAPTIGANPVSAASAPRAAASTPVTSTPAAPAAPTAAADAGDLGWPGPSYAGSTGSPSGSKPESKLWYAYGKWWGALFDVGTGDFHIFRLDLASQTWIDTNTPLDLRSDSRSDALWDGSYLYVASHVFTESPTAGSPSYLNRYTYNPTAGTWSLDRGYPVTINTGKVETLVIDEDSTGRLWATWVSGRNVYVTNSTTGPTVWATPFLLPVQGSALTSDDVSSLLSFGGDRIGLMWSNQNDEKMYFATHLDTAAPGTWTAREVAYEGPSAADDHINLKSVSDTNGRVLAAVKTSKSASGDPLVNLLERAPGGGWTSHVFGTQGDRHTRPIVVVDSQRQIVHMFATRGQSGGPIVEKQAPLSNIDFAPGAGTEVLRDADSGDLNNATSTKQAVDGGTGLVVVATNDSTRQYWTYYDPLGGTPPPPPAAWAPFASAAAFADQQSADFLAGPSGAVVALRFAAGDDAGDIVVDPQFFDSADWNGSDTGRGARVARLYLAYFQRGPDRGGLDFWRAQLAAGRSLSSISTAFAGSSEFNTTYDSLDNSEFVDLVYQNVLERAPDAGGATYWTARLDGGLTRGGMMVRFSESSEFVRTERPTVGVALLWRAMYDAAATSNELSLVSASGRPLPQVVDDILASDRYQARADLGR